MNKLTKILSITALVAMTTLTGCASILEPSYHADWSQNGVEITHDKFEKSTQVKGARTLRATNDFYDKTFFRAWVVDESRTKELGIPEGLDFTPMQLYVIAHGYDWMFLDRAMDINGQEFTVKRIDSDVSCSTAACSHFEHVGVDITKKYLQEHKEGFELKLAGRGGAKIITVSKEQIEQILTALEQVHADNK